MPVSLSYRPALAFTVLYMECGESQSLPSTSAGSVRAQIVLHPATWLTCEPHCAAVLWTPLSLHLCIIKIYVARCCRVDLRSDVSLYTAVHKDRIMYVCFRRTRRHSELDSSVIKIQVDCHIITQHDRVVHSMKLYPPEM